MIIQNSIHASGIQAGAVRVRRRVRGLSGKDAAKGASEEWSPGAERFAKRTTTPKVPVGRAPKVRVNRTANARIFSLAVKAVLRFISTGYRDVYCLIFSTFDNFAQLFHAKFTQALRRLGPCADDVR